jgi:predicted RND superfamily exporter protein
MDPVIRSARALSPAAFAVAPLVAVLFAIAYGYGAMFLVGVPAAIASRTRA